MFVFKFLDGVNAICVNAALFPTKEEKYRLLLDITRDTICTVDMAELLFSSNFLILSFTSNSAPKVATKQ